MDRGFDSARQAEHGPDSPTVLVTTSEDLGQKVLDLIPQAIDPLQTREAAGTAWGTAGKSSCAAPARRQHRCRTRSPRSTSRSTPATSSGGTTPSATTWTLFS
ncbi:MAG: histidinol dehydrogenase [Nocardioides sp.]|nr:histidinol dehydrogenase [Nocardioides sp.]